VCAAVGAASQQHVLEACTVCGDCTVCSCRNSKSSARTLCSYPTLQCSLFTTQCELQVWNVFKNDTALRKNLSALTELVMSVQGFHFTPQCTENFSRVFTNNILSTVYFYHANNIRYVLDSCVYVERRAGREMVGRNCTFRASGFVTLSIYYGGGGVLGHKKKKNVKSILTGRLK